jgi:putative transposase
MPKRFNKECDIHFLTFSTYKRMRVFTDDGLCKLFVSHLKSAWRRKKFKLYAFVIMPNHIHLLIKPAMNDTVGKLLGIVKKSFSLEALEYVRLTNPELYQSLKIIIGGTEKRRFWQAGGGYDRNIIGEKALFRTVNYIHMNPIRKSTANNPMDYKWSSLQYWVSGSSKPLRMDDLHVS